MVRNPKLTDDNRPAFSLDGIGMSLLLDTDRFRTGSILMRFNDTEINVSDKNGKPVGAFGCALGGCLYVEIENRLWKINGEDLFRAALERDRQYVAANAGR